MDSIANDPKFAYSSLKSLTMKPSDYFRRQCWLGSSLVHRREIEMRQAIGVDRMMWGWDFPHIESADWLTPRENIRAVMQGVPEDELRAMLAGNAIEAYRLDADKLRRVAELVGPTVAELVTA